MKNCNDGLGEGLVKSLSFYMMRLSDMELALLGVGISGFLFLGFKLRSLAFGVGSHAHAHDYALIVSHYLPLPYTVPLSSRSSYTHLVLAWVGSVLGMGHGTWGYVI
jgi:hypothetical protein